MFDAQEINIDRCGLLIDWYYDAFGTASSDI